MHPAATRLWIPVMLLLAGCADDPTRHDDIMDGLLNNALSAPGASPIQPPDIDPTIATEPDMLIDSVRRQRPVVRHGEFVFE